MKVLLVKDVYKLGHAGDVKKVADGYGRNYLIPQGLAVLATAGAMKGIETIKKQAAVQRANLNNELSGLAEQVKTLNLSFASKAGETGKLYGSITHQMIIDAVNSKLGTQLEHHIVDVEPIRTLGEHKAHLRLTVDLVPEFSIVVYREGEAAPVVAEAPAVEAAPLAEAAKEVVEATSEPESPAAETPEEAA
jgi:large subunit ribosomal protein L9